MVKRKAVNPLDIFDDIGSEQPGGTSVARKSLAAKVTASSASKVAASATPENVGASASHIILGQAEEPSQKKKKTCAKKKAGGGSSTGGSFGLSARDLSGSLFGYGPLEAHLKGHDYSVPRVYLGPSAPHFKSPKCICTCANARSRTSTHQIIEMAHRSLYNYSIRRPIVHRRAMACSHARARRFARFPRVGWTRCRLLLSHLRDPGTNHARSQQSPPLSALALGLEAIARYSRPQLKN